MCTSRICCFVCSTSFRNAGLCFIAISSGVPLQMAKAYFNKCPNAKADPGKGGVAGQSGRLGGRREGGCNSRRGGRVQWRMQWTCQPAKTSGRLSSLEKEKEGREWRT